MTFTILRSSVLLAVLSASQTDAQRVLGGTCTNNAAWNGGVSTGCDKATPLCFKKSGGNGDLVTLSAYGKGDECGKCVNLFASEMHVDSGCSASKPVCLKGNNQSPTLGTGGTYCAENNFACFNSIGPGHTTPDKLCTKENPVCVGDKNQEVDAACYGFKCVPCMNTAESIYAQDDGCPASAPRCVNEAGQDPPIWHGGVRCVPPPPNNEPPEFCPDGVRKIRFNKYYDSGRGQWSSHGDYVSDFQYFTVDIHPNKNAANLELGAPNNPNNYPRIFDSTLCGDEAPNCDLQIFASKLLIIQEKYEDASDTEPDDSASGGWMRFKFPTPTDVVSIGLVDNEEDNYRLKLKGSGLDKTIQMTSARGDGQKSKTKVDEVGVEEMIIKAPGSMGVWFVEICK